MRRFVQMTTKGAFEDRWVAQPFDSWREFPLALWRLWKTRRYWL